MILQILHLNNDKRRQSYKLHGKTLGGGGSGSLLGVERARCGTA